MIDAKFFFRFVIGSTFLVASAFAASTDLSPLEHFKGNRLRELREQILQGAEAAANAGAGFEAARLLQGLAQSGETDDIAKRASGLLNRWGLTNEPLTPGREVEIDQLISGQLRAEHLGRADLSKVEILIELEEYQAASTILLRVSQNAKGEVQNQLDRFARRYGVSLPNLASDQENAPEIMEERLRSARQLIRRIEAAEFLLKADPAAGAMYWALLHRLSPEAESVRQARRDQEPDPRSRFGFGRRVMPPGLQQRFGGRFGRFFGGGEESEEPVAQEVVPTVEGVIQSLDFLAKDDTELALDLLRMAIQYFKEDPAKARLDEVQEQANRYVLGLQADMADRSQVKVKRFEGERKAGKAGRIFSGKHIPTYELEIAPEEWGKLKKDTKTYVRATFRSGDTVLKDIGVRLKGGIGSYRPLEEGNKVGLTLKLNQFVPGQKFLGLRKIVLNNSVQDSSYLREKLGYSLFRKAGLPASRVGHAEVAINGKPYGLYVQIEAVTSDFLKRWFNDGKGDLYEGSYGADVTDWENLEVDSNPETVDREQLRRLSEAADQAMEEGSLDPLRPILDLVAFTRFTALEVLMDHWDGYVSANNYRLYRDPKSKRFYFIPHGADQLFRNSGGALFRESRGHIGRVVLSTDEGRGLYLAQVRDLLDHVLNPESARDGLREQYDRIRDRVAADPMYSGTGVDFDRQMLTTLQFFERKQRISRWQEIALDDADLSRRLESLNRDPRSFFRNRGRGRR